MQLETIENSVLCDNCTHMVVVWYTGRRSEDGGSQRAYMWQSEREFGTACSFKYKRRTWQDSASVGEDSTAATPSVPVLCMRGDTARAARVGAWHSGCPRHTCYAIRRFCSFPGNDLITSDKLAASAIIRLGDAALCIIVHFNRRSVTPCPSR